MTPAFNALYDPYGVGSLGSLGWDRWERGRPEPVRIPRGINDRASGLVKFGIRWYNPVPGTWTQQDTLDAPLDPANANRYLFAGGDPINGADPDGQVSGGLTVGGDIYLDFTHLDQEALLAGATASLVAAVCTTGLGTAFCIGAVGVVGAAGVS